MKIKKKKNIIYIVLKVIILLVLFIPIINIFYNSFLWFSNNWYFLLKSWIINTLEILIWSLIVSSIIAIPSAIILGLYNIKFSKIFIWIFILTLVIPWYSLALIYSEYFNFFFSKFWLMTILWIASSPYIFLSVYSSLINISTKYITTWYSLWLNNINIIKKILFPLLKPAISIWIIIVIAEVISDFWASYFLWVNTLMVNIYSLFFQIQDRITWSQFSLILLFIIILFYLSFKPFKNKLGKYTNKINFNDIIWKNKISLTNNFTKVIVYLYLILVSLLIFIIPIIILFIWLYKIISIWNNSWIDYIEHFLLPLKNTLLLAFLWVIFINIIWYILLKLFRKNSNILNLLNLLYSIPWIIIWIGLLSIIPYINGYIANLLFLLLWLTIKIVPLVFNNLYIHYIKINSKLRKVWYSLWNNRFSYIKKVELPLLKQGFIVSSALVYIEIIRELPITLILKPFNFETLSTQIFFFQHTELIEKASLWIVSLIILTIIPLIYFYKNKFFNNEK